MAASISYYTLFSLFPITLLAVSIFGIVLRDASVQQRVIEGFSEILPLQPDTVENLLGEAAELGPTVSVLSFFGAIWSAGALSSSIRQALNQVFQARSKRPLFQAKMIDFVLLPIIGIPLLAGVVLSTLWRFFQRELDDRYGLLDGRLSWTWEAGAVLIPLVMSFLAFAALYAVAPGERRSWRYLVPGALLAAVAFEALKGAFGLYLQHFFNESIYGSLGSAIILLFWVYLTANIMIFGGEVAAEIPHVLHQEPRHGVEGMDEGGWRRATISFVRGLFMVHDEEVVDLAPGRAPVRRNGSGTPADRDHPSK
jgi:membrane protein